MGLNVSESIVQLRNLDDLKKVLFLQKTIITQAKNELMSVISGTDPSLIGEAKKFLDQEKAILDKYAKYPTLTEFQLMPSSFDGYKWGATFGVTLLVGELIFEQLKSSHPHFGGVIRPLFVLLLSELEDPQHEYLIEPLEKHLRFKITTENGEAVPLKKQKAYVRDLVSQLADTMVALCESYGIVKVKKGGVAITPLGKRVLLHLLDASKFVEDMTTAHAKFQTAKPKLSMSI